MTDLSDEQLQQALERQRPGFKLVRRESQRWARGAADAEVDSSTSRRGAPDAETPSIEELKQKYLGRRGSASVSGARAAGPAQPETELVVVERDQSADAFDRGAGRKAVLLDEQGNIISEQG